jgi:hypothetical protein
MALQTSPEKPVPVRVVSQAIGGWIAIMAGAFGHANYWPFLVFGYLHQKGIHHPRYEKDYEAIKRLTGLTDGQFSTNHNIKAYD